MIYKQKASIILIATHIVKLSSQIRLVEHCWDAALGNNVLIQPGKGGMQIRFFSTRFLVA